MLESSFIAVRSDPGMARLAQSGQPQAEPQPVFRMEADPEGRIDGSIPVWDYHPTAANSIAGTLTEASRGQLGNGAALTGANTYYANPANQANAPHAFGFKDLFDMVNPLQHIPLVSNVYRYLTGDQIQPVSQVMGDAAYGGPLSAAASLINAIVKDATGKDLAGNLISLAFNDAPKASPAAPDAEDVKVAANDASLSGLPGTVLSFADLRGPIAAKTSVSAFGPSPYDLY
jgi:hypothetical protein